ncbi:MAG: hypothetical protein KDE04_00660 [Anaerolineales bacterium]|nr:hypothetical protein [Anaerolineales bacterium]
MLAALRRLPLWSLALISGIIYLIFALWFPLTAHYNQAPLADVYSLGKAWWQGLLYGLLLTALFGAYGLAWWRVEAGDRPVRTIWLAAILFILLLLFVFPINATDIYRYFIRGRVASFYGESPYLFAPDQFPDPYLPLAGEWQSFTSPYGPLWEMVAFGVTWLVQWLAPAGRVLLTGLLGFKLLAAGLFLGSGYLLSRDRGPARLLLWLWNPALLLTFIANGHNDSLMLFWFMAGWLCVRREKLYLAWFLFMLAVLSKPIGLLALPFLFIYLWRREVGTGRWLQFAGLTTLMSLLLVWLLFLPFGSPLDLGRRLLTESTGFPGFSLVTLIILARNHILGPTPYGDITRIALVLFALATLGLLWLAWRGRAAQRNVADIFFLYVLQAASFRIWYASWLWPWLLLDEGEDGKTGRRLLAGALYLYLTQLSVVIYAHLRTDLLAGEQLWAHALAIPLVFGLPLSVLWGGGRAVAGADSHSDTHPA